MKPVSALFDPLSVSCLVLLAALVATVFIGVRVAQGVDKKDFSNFLAQEHGRYFE